MTLPIQIWFILGYNFHTQMMMVYQWPAPFFPNKDIIVEDQPMRNQQRWSSRNRKNGGSEGLRNLKWVAKRQQNSGLNMGKAPQWDSEGPSDLTRFWHPKGRSGEKSWSGWWERVMWCYMLIIQYYLYSINIGLYWIIYSKQLRIAFMFLLLNTLYGWFVHPLWESSISIWIKYNELIATSPEWWLVGATIPK